MIVLLWKRFCLLLVLNFALCKVAAGQNLVVNPDFESFTICPVFPTGINGNGVTNWTQPTNATSDFFHACNMNGILDVPNNTISVGYQNALSGDAYGGIIAWALDPTTPIEYLQNQLSSPLVAGQEYTVTVNVSLANNCDYYINNMGAYFSSTMVSTGNNVQLTFSPQVTFGGIMNDTTNWMTLSQNFIATGGEQYLILGNFIPVALTNIPTGWAGSNSGLGIAYYYFEDISVEAVITPITVDLGPDTTLCAGSQLLLDATAPGSTYLWQDNSIQPSYNVTSAGTYWVQIMDSLGTTASDTIVVNYMNQPTVNLGNDTTLCQPSTLVLDANAPGLSVLWSTLDTTQTITVGSSGNYSVLVTNGWCSATDSILVTINPPPAVAFTFSNGCVNDPIPFVNNSSPGNYLWTFGDGGSSILNSPQNTYTSAGNFNVQLIVESNGCYDSLTQVVTVSDVPLVGFSATPVEGCAPLTSYFTNTGDSGLVYFWNFNDGATDNFENGFHEFIAPGTYTIELTATNSFGCVASASQIDYISVHPAANASFYASPEITVLNSIVQFTNTSTAATSWSWDFGQGSVSSQENPSMSYTVPGTYITELIVNNSFGCPDTAYLIIEVRDNPAIYFPNSFTPNNDGYNDVFYVQGVGFQHEFLLEIFDRWGELIFVGHDKNEVWDGLINGNEAIQGTYTWKFQAKMSDGLYYEYVGHITLIK